MAYSHEDDVDQNVDRGEKSEEVILHHSLTRFRMHHRHAESPHGQQIGGDVFAWTADWRYGGAFINASGALVAFRWSQLPTQHMDSRYGAFSHHGIESEAKIFTF